MSINNKDSSDANATRWPRAIKGAIAVQLLTRPCNSKTHGPAFMPFPESRWRCLCFLYGQLDHKMASDHVTVGCSNWPIGSAIWCAVLAHAVGGWWLVERAKAKDWPEPPLGRRPGHVYVCASCRFGSPRSLLVVRLVNPSVVCLAVVIRRLPLPSHSPALYTYSR